MSQNNKKTAFGLLIDNLVGKEKSYINVVTSLQDEFFVPSLNNDNLKSIDQWDQREYFEANEIDNNIPAVLPGLYSSFAIKEFSSSFAVHYPLKEDYATTNFPFKNFDMSNDSYTNILQNIKDKLSVNVIKNNTNLVFYKRKLALKNKCKNLFLKLTKKQTKLNYSGTIYLKSKYIISQDVSNSENLIKIYDYLLSVSQKSQKKLKKVSNEIKYASRLFANILVCRATDFSSVQNYQKANKCLSLQFANLLNKYQFDSKQLQDIVKFGTLTAGKLCEDLGYTKEQIMEQIEKNGYKYGQIPNTMFNALLLADKNLEKIYFNSTETVKEETKQTESKEETKKTGDSSKTENKSDKTDNKSENKSENIMEDAKNKQNVIYLPRDISAYNKQQELKKLREFALDVNNFDHYMKMILKTCNTQPNAQELTSKISTLVTSKQDIATKKSLSKKLVTKHIDELVRCNLAKKSVGASKPNVTKPETILKNKRRSALYALTLAYYESNIRFNCDINIGQTLSDQEIELTKTLGNELYQKREQFSDMIISKQDEKNAGQKIKSFINEICQKINDKTLNNYFVEPIIENVEEFVKNNKDKQI